MNRLDPPWLTEPAVQRLLAALTAAGIEARFVGGCVRDTLLGLDPIAVGGDIDLATPAPPEAVIAALTEAGLKALPTGLAHGTVTAVVKSHGAPRNFEITTLRRDVETDGRHAAVTFDADWEEDAKRRDFTINAIYLASDGTLYDPVGGRADLAASRVRFVGAPATRIAEDVLRLLRYYRFEARFGADLGNPAARAACREALGKLPSLSAERVSHELMRLLAVPQPTRAVQLMDADGVLSALLPEAKYIGRLESAIPLSPDPLLRLAALLEVSKAGAMAVADRLRLSNAERSRLAGLATPWPVNPAGDAKAQRLTLYRLGRERYRDLLLLTAADGCLDIGCRRELLEFSETWPIPRFPLGGGDVTALGIAPGPQVGKLLGAVRRWWEDGDFSASRDECLARLRYLVQDGRDR